LLVCSGCLAVIFEPFVDLVETESCHFPYLDRRKGSLCSPKVDAAGCDEAVKGHPFLVGYAASQGMTSFAIFGDKHIASSPGGHCGPETASIFLYSRLFWLVIYGIFMNKGPTLEACAGDRFWSEMVKVQQAAKDLGVSRSALYKWIREGKLKKDSHGLVRRYDVERLIGNKTSRGRPLKERTTSHSVGSTAETLQYQSGVSPAEADTPPIPGSGSTIRRFRAYKEALPEMTLECAGAVLRDLKPIEDYCRELKTIISPLEAEIFIDKSTTQEANAELAPDCFDKELGLTWCSPRQAAMLADCHIRTIYKWIRVEILDVVQTKPFRIDTDSLKDLIELGYGKSRGYDYLERDKNGHFEGGQKLKVQQAAKASAVSQSALYKWIHEGKLKKDSHGLVRCDDVEWLIRNKTSRGRPLKERETSRSAGSWFDAIRSQYQQLPEDILRDIFLKPTAQTIIRPFRAYKEALPEVTLMPPKLAGVVLRDFKPIEDFCREVRAIISSFEANL